LAVWVLREYIFDPGREAQLTTGAAYAAELEVFASGRDPLSPDTAHVVRSQPKDARIVMRETPETQNFQLELRSRGFGRLEKGHSRPPKMAPGRFLMPADPLPFPDGAYCAQFGIKVRESYRQELLAVGSSF
jgi:hypothetical protein